MRTLRFIDQSGNITDKPAENLYFQSVISFLEEFRSKAEIVVNTSGSTGKPKKIVLKKDQIIASVHQTASAFTLKKGDIVFCALPISYIAGKLMLLRAEILGLDALVAQPNSNPFLCLNTETNSFFQENVGKFLFAFVPYQLENIVNSNNSAEFLNTAKAVLSGGAALSKSTEEKLIHQNAPVYETYGMTETVTHVAIRKIADDFQKYPFQFLDGIEHKTTEGNNLVVKGLVTNNEWVYTNDIIEYTSNNSFRLLGRADNVINSGGIKLHPELIEIKISKILSNHNFTLNFFCFGKPDPSLGQILVLFVEFSEGSLPVNVLNDLKNKLPKYEVPKEIILLKNFVYTLSNKLNRKLTAQNYFK